MHVDVVEDHSPDFTAYASIPIAFDVTQVIVVDASGSFSVRPIATPYTKDYDGYPGNRPRDWASRFDVSDWCVLVAYDRDTARRVGGAVVIPRESGIEPAGRHDVAVLWDLRVAPWARRSGVGRALLVAAEAWALGRGTFALSAETQDVNVAACLFYARHGFTLDAVNRAAYAALPNETQLLWRKQLTET